ncbi:tRNA (adenosine(37)-N6)-threonylcarbamoyltransferase complex transferase subunit TsaD [candidate division WOR-3 bacterium]|uniref:tRNA N6-adenosine threonylcarbamoyltransferase n=1 Tax=candidate division WOR-3 bacterium TaxID=2052148 RepID=A0A660SG77_UNCW3|nr:MAG: tRNA (adenosine(37)-N6)-threonylcarbamoyltransferase complex transferase subunit TsaD [candidate division WOR-3 bacterium]
MIVAGIETSCDETGVGIIADDEIRANIVRSQVIHSRFGGVVPELAARDHIRNIIPVLKTALREAEISIADIELFAYTRGPGLLGALLVGSTFTRALALATHRPSIGVSHIEAHIYSLYPELNYPILILIVSGGHTELIIVRDEFVYQPIGTTIDDACGEAFDKVARILGRPYPGGPEIERLARKGDPDRVQFPIPKTDRFDFSFSGLKTAVLYYTRDHPDVPKEDIAAGFQKVVVEYLVMKAEAAAREFKIPRIGVCGGVSANLALREAFRRLDYEILFPDPLLSVDNGVMVAFCGKQRFFRFGPSPPDLPVFATKKGLL